MDFGKNFPERDDVFELIDVSDILVNDVLHRGERVSNDVPLGIMEETLSRSDVDKLVDVTEEVFDVSLP